MQESDKTKLQGAALQHSISKDTHEPHKSRLEILEGVIKGCHICLQAGCPGFDYTFFNILKNSSTNLTMVAAGGLTHNPPSICGHLVIADPSADKRTDGLLS